MLDSRFKKFYERSREFLGNVTSLDQVLYEMKVSHEELMEIIQIHSELCERFNSIERRYSHFLSEKRDLVFEKFKSVGVSATQLNIEDRVVRTFKQEFLDLKREYDEAKLNLDTANNIKSALFQRKEYLKSLADFFNTKHEAESCIMTNKAFVRRLISKLGE